MTTDILVFVPALIPVIIALVQVAKGIGLDGRFAPVAAIFLGVIFCDVGLALSAVTVSSSAGLLPIRAEAFWTTLYGILAGLQASGLYSGFQAVRGT